MVFSAPVAGVSPNRRTSHYSQRADWACDSGQRVSVRPGLFIPKSGLCARPRVADLGRWAKILMDEKIEARIEMEMTAKSEELMKEFVAHRDAFIAKHPDKADERRIFEGWALQKIAGLHCSVLQHAKQIARLESERRTQ